jgi:hypothetical protein
VVGGVASQEQLKGNGLAYFNDVWASEDLGRTWTQVGDDDHSFESRSECALIESDSSLLLLGGTNGMEDFNDVWESTDNGNTWICVRPSTGPSLFSNMWCCRHAFFACSDRKAGLVIVGGGTDLTGNSFDDVHASADGGKSWVKVRGRPGASEIGG